MKLKKLEDSLEIPEKTEVKYEEGVFIVKGPEGEASKKLINPKVKIEIKDKMIIFSAKNATKMEKKTIATFKAHTKNLLRGVNEKYVYKLKVCSGHFPMTVELKGSELIVKNLFGESVPRVLKIKKGAEVKVEGAIISVQSTEKEVAGQVAAEIENLTKRTEFDRRVFQDGIYITQKGKKEIK